MKQLALSILLLIVLTIPAVMDLFIPGPYSSHDLVHHIIRTVDMDTMLKEGAFPPRWSGHLNNEYGYPVFLFNYPLPALVAVGIHKLGWGYIDSTKGVFILSMFLSTVGMYLFLRSYLGQADNLAAILGSIFYLYAPIRFVNVYVSAQIGGSLALGLVPFVFWCTDRLLTTGERKWVLLGGVFLSLLILAHNVSTLLFLPVLTLFVALQVLRSKFKRSLSARFALLILLGFGLSCWFWLPSIVEKKYIVYDKIMDHFWADQFIEPWQLVNSKWDYGFSLPKGESDGMSFQVGYIHILAVLLSLILAVWYWLKKQDHDFVENNLYWIGVFLASVFLVLEISYWVWEVVPLLGYTQFQFRILALTVFAASVCAALILTKLPYKYISFFLLAGLVVYGSRNQWHINQTLQLDDKFYQGQKTTTAAFNEHLPKWAKPESQMPNSKIQILNGQGQVIVSENRSQKVVALVDLKTDSTLRLNQFFFPGWQVKVDGENVDFDYVRAGQSRGLMVFNLPKGTHQIVAEFTETPIRSTSDLISLVSLGVLLLLITYKNEFKTCDWRHLSSA